MLFFINEYSGANCFKEGSNCFDLGGGTSFKRKVSTELFWLSSLVAIAGSFKLCSLCFIRKLKWKLLSTRFDLLKMFSNFKLPPSHCSLHCNRGTTSPPRPTVVDWNKFWMLMKKMSLHVDLRLTVAVFGAALCPPWTALCVLQVGLVCSVIRYNGESHWTND